MPLQNRVTPEGEIIATPARGTMMGNRGGCFHTADKALAGRRWVSRQWICCELAFRGRHREVMAPRRYTELFFLDETTALAAGHRPCFECRRGDAMRFTELWAEACARPSRPRAADMDRVLHAERLLPDGGKRVFSGRLGDLPSGCMVREAEGVSLIAGGRLLPWTCEGYGVPREFAPARVVEVLTPPAIVALLHLGLAPRLHASARR